MFENFSFNQKFSAYYIFDTYDEKYQFPFEHKISINTPFNVINVNYQEAFYTAHMI